MTLGWPFGGTTTVDPGAGWTTTVFSSVVPQAVRITAEIGIQSHEIRIDNS
jgi:hypothetical protein